MRITGVETGRRPVHLRSPFRTALREVRDFDVVTISVLAEGGVTGCSEVVGTAQITGETNASIEEAVNSVLAPVLIGRDLGDYSVALADISSAMVGNNTAKCGIDVAVHRAVARWQGTTLWGLFGATPRPVATDVTVSLAAPSDMAAEARGRADDGFGTLKLKVGGPVALDIERVRAIAGAIPADIVLRIDANQAWTARQALQVIDGLVQAGVAVEFVEQPVAAGDLAGLAAVTARSPVPVVADESAHSAADVRRLADAGACDAVNIKLAKCGGLQAGLEVAAVARTCGLGLLFGSMLESGSGVAATAVLASRLAADQVHDLDAGWWAETEIAAVYRPPFVDCGHEPVNCGHEPGPAAVALVCGNRHGADKDGGMTRPKVPGEKDVERPGGSAELAGRLVGRIGFGAMQLPGPRVFGPPRDRATALALLRRVVDLGINHIDTAQYYGPDVSNELIHAALFPYPEDLVLVSKVGAQRDEQGGWGAAQRPEQLRAGVEANLASLGVDQVHVVNLRLHPHEDEDGGVDFDSQVAEMTALRDEGKIGAIGLSNVSLDQLRQALPAGPACVQNAYSVLDRSGEPLLELCRGHGIAWVPFFPLGSAFSWMARVTEHPAVVTAAAATGATPAQVGLAWLLGHDPRILLIPGTSSLEHLAENVAAGEVRLSAETVAVLDSLGGPAN